MANFTNTLGLENILMASSISANLFSSSVLLFCTRSVSHLIGNDCSCLVISECSSDNITMTTVYSASHEQPGMKLAIIEGACGIYPSE